MGIEEMSMKLNSWTERWGFNNESLDAFINEYAEDYEEWMTMHELLADWYEEE